VRARCRTARPRPRPRSAIGISRPSPSAAAWGGRGRPGTTVAPLAEAAIGRFKRAIGGALRSRTDRRQATEVAIAVDVLNRMLKLGRPESVRIA
jgi:hypothetical protein